MGRKHTGIRCMLFVLLLSGAAALHGEPALHVIDSYIFDIPGKSWESVVRRHIIPDKGDESFATVEQLEEALEEKRRSLFNMRIFNEVSYSYTLIDADADYYYYEASYYIDDAITFLPIPYAKYDSNYGVRGGFRIYERNLLGSFSDLFFYAMVTQVDHSWDTVDFRSSLTIDDIPLGESTLDIMGRVDFLLHDWREIDEAVIRGQITANNIPIRDNTLSLSAYMQLDDVSEPDKPPVWGKGEIRLTTDIGRIRLFGEPFAFHYGLTLEQTDDTWAYPDLRSFLRLTWLDLTFLDQEYSLLFSSDQRVGLREDFTFTLERNRFTVQLQSQFNFPLRMTYRPTLSTTFEMDHLFFIPSNFMVSTHHAFTRGSIYWTNNMREGSRFSLQLDGDFILNRHITQFSDRFNAAAALSYTGFWLPHPRLNLSLRTMGFYARRPLASEKDFGIPQDYREFPTFIPGSSHTPADQLRGILHKDLDGGENEPRKAGAIANIDITILPVKIQGFAEGFGTLFLDFGVFDRVRRVDEPTSTNLISSDDLEIYYTGGIEIMGILDRFRSYPVRASLGLNLKDVREYLQGDLAHWRDIGRELTISMELHY